jgi:hypothetical protein
MVILGGAANNIGVLAGTFIFVAVRQTIAFYRDIFEPILPFNIVWLDTLLLGLALLVILIYRPEGLVPEKPVKTIYTGQPHPDKKNEKSPDRQATWGRLNIEGLLGALGIKKKRKDSEQT